MILINTAPFIPKTFVYTQNVAMEIGDHRAELSIRAGINLLLVSNIFA